MTTTQSTENTDRPLPVWLSIPIILACLAGGGWIIHWYVMTDPISHETKILGDAPVQAQWQGGGGRNRFNGPRRGIDSQPNGRWAIHTEKAHANFAVENGKAIYKNVFYTNRASIPQPARQTFEATSNLLKDSKRVEALKLTSTQRQKLDALSKEPPTVVLPADKILLTNAVGAYVAADVKYRPEMEPKILNLLDEISDRSMNATAKEAADRAAQIDQIITPDMWKLNASMGGGGK
jgi:hypothetical protein